MPCGSLWLISISSRRTKPRPLPDYLGATDPREIKTRIEQTNGGLLEPAYRWILDHPEFVRWRDEEDARLLWIKGDPSQGVCSVASPHRTPRNPRFSGRECSSATQSLDTLRASVRFLTQTSFFYFFCSTHRCPSNMDLWKALAPTLPA